MNRIKPIIKRVTYTGKGISGALNVSVVKSRLWGLSTIIPVDGNLIFVVSRPTGQGFLRNYILYAIDFQDTAYS